MSDSPEQPGVDPAAIAELINDASAKFDQMCLERHEEGAEKYGPFKFLTANVAEEAMFELVDLANYARYLFIKLYLMDMKLDEVFANQVVNIGPGSFSSGRPSLTLEEDEK